MKKIKVTLKGLSPLLMNNIESMMQEEKIKTRNQTYDSKEEARKSAYITKIDGKPALYVPSRCIYGMLIKSAGYFKIKMRSASSLIAGAVDITPEEVPIMNKGKILSTYEIDKRAVVIQRSRIIKSRPIIKEWEITFNLVYNDNYIADDKLLRKIIEDGGIKVGLLDFRPACRGNFGKFEIKEWKA